MNNTLTALELFDIIEEKVTSLEWEGTLLNHTKTGEPIVALFGDPEMVEMFRQLLQQTKPRKTQH